MPSKNRPFLRQRSETYISECIIWLLTGSILAWFWIHEGWFNIELFHVSEVLSTPPHNASVWSQLKVVFDWTVFDGVTSRLRPLSDLVEVIDAALRPLRIFGRHASLTIVAIALALGTIRAFYCALIRRKLPALHAALLTLLLVTTVGYLSCYVPYIRPAKKLVLFFTAATLLLTSTESGSKRAFALLWFSVFCGFYSDEAGFVLWPISMLLAGPAIISGRRWARGILLFLLPFCYIVTTTWVIPYIYGLVAAPRHTSPDAAAYVVTFLLAPKYYWVAAQDLACGVLISLGIAGPSPWAIHFAIGLMTAVVAYCIYRKKWRVVAASGSLIAMSFGLTLFDMFNIPFKSQPLGQITYYYHSPIGILTIFVLATLELRTFILLPLVICVGSANIRDFYIINRALMIENIYPAEPRELPKYVLKPEELNREYHELTPHFQGQNKDWYQNNFEYYKVHPMGNADYARRYSDLFKSHQDGR